MAEPWARISIRVTQEGLTSEDLGEFLGPSSGRHTEIWVRDVEATSEVPLDEQLRRAGSLLEELSDGLGRLTAEYDMSVLVSWTPRQGQDGLALPRTFINQLAAVGATLLLDTYTDD